MPSLDAVADRTQLAGVVTQPDRPAGRGQRLQPSPVKQAALARAIEVYEPASLRSFAQTIASVPIDAFVVASYGRILPAELLAVPDLGALNVHPSLLPRFRGATPIQAALLAGDTETGVTIMLMDAGMDTGDVVLQERVPVEPGETYGALHDRLAALGARLLSRAIELGERDGGFPHRAQEGEASVTRPIRKTDLDIDWSWSTQRIVNHVRAYAPQPAARATLDGVAVKVLQARRFEGGRDETRIGAIAGVLGDSALVGAGDGIVAVERLVAPSHAAETGAAFARRMSAR